MDLLSTMQTDNLEKKSKFLLTSILLNSENKFCGYIYTIENVIDDTHRKKKYQDDFQTIYICSDKNEICQIFNGETPEKELYIKNYYSHKQGNKVIPCILRTFNERFVIKSIWNFDILKFEAFSLKDIEAISNYLLSII